ncbi:AraC family transcriptional regulator [Mordavella massiliensis]|uniref:AraC family transcriptional regulator n=1 Tax=Mordavella massiliensis TaxID=1871024 RepID=A0A938X1Z3_9CLOT|nr:AraC family transcriptional regulator [Mordavella massiliensis]MBM6826498.1 AraC family transcriptional regulator [Mordavella massiliensis]
MIEFGDTITDERGREDLGHVAGGFPVGCYFDDLSHKTIPWHWHGEMEAGIVAEGRIRFRTPGQDLSLSKGDGFFVNSEVLHEMHREEEGPCEVHILAFQPELAGAKGSIFWDKYIFPVLGNPQLEGMGLDRDLRKPVRDLIEDAWLACVKEEEGFEIRVREDLTRLLLLLGGKYPASAGKEKGGRERSRRYNERMKQMLTFIREHYGEPLTAEQIAASASVSPSECLRCFRSVLGTTPISYLRDYRLQTAAKLLAGTSRKISDITDQCGFSEMSYFAKSFREMYHCTPSAYRNGADPVRTGEGKY